MITGKERFGWLKEFDISRHRYFELKHIALQYDEMREDEAKLRRGEVDRKEGGNQAWKRPDPTGNKAIGDAMASKADRIRAIEESARAVAENAGMWIYGRLMENVTQGIQYAKMIPPPPCREDYFYDARKLFFVELNKRI